MYTKGLSPLMGVIWQKKNIHHQHFLNTHAVTPQFKLYGCLRDAKLVESDVPLDDDLTQLSQVSSTQTSRQRHLTLQLSPPLLCFESKVILITFYTFTPPFLMFTKSFHCTVSTHRFAQLRWPRIARPNNCWLHIATSYKAHLFPFFLVLHFQTLFYSTATHSFVRHVLNTSKLSDLFYHSSSL